MSAPDTYSHQLFHVLYQDHHGWLQGWLRRSTGCSERAADIAHDTFLRLLLNRYQDFSSHPRALLQRIARNLIIDYGRRQEVERAYLAALAQLPEAEMPSAESQALIVESLLRIESALSRLPQQTQRIFELSQFDGMKQQSIADQLGICINSVRRHLQKALSVCILAE